MNYIIRVKVVEALGNAGELSMGVRVEGTEHDGHLRVPIGPHWADS